MIIQRSGGERARRLIPGEGRALEGDPAISFQTGGGHGGRPSSRQLNRRPLTVPAGRAPGPCPAGAAGGRQRGSRGMPARPPAPSGTAPWRGGPRGAAPVNGRAARSGMRPQAPGPGARPPAPDGASAPSPARTAPGERGRAAGKAPSGPRCRYGWLRPARKKAAWGYSARSQAPAAWKRAPRGPSSSYVGEKKGGAAEGSPRGAPAPEPAIYGSSAVHRSAAPCSPTG